VHPAARRAPRLIAIGLKDVWPRVPGLEQIYGDRAHVCPDCDGHSTQGRKTVVLGRGRKAVGMALNLANWADDITVCTNGEDPGFDDYLLGKLRENGIPVREGRVARVQLRDDTLRSLEFEDGTALGCEKIFFAIGQYPADDLAAQLGCDRDPEGHVEVDDAYHTSVYNVFAAGDIVPGPQLGIARRRTARSRAAHPQVARPRRAQAQEGRRAREQADAPAGVGGRRGRPVTGGAP
jgi:thioredoxin reductase